MQNMDNFKIILTKRKIQRRIKALGAQITKDYKGKEPVVIGMLKGAVYFFVDLTKNIKVPLTEDFARLSSYRNGIESGDMELVNDIKTDVTGKDVIIIEDIVDSGKTLSYYISLLKQKNPTSIKICALLDKRECRKVPLDVDYVGFDVPVGFVVGYGLDYAEKYREWPFIAEVIDPSKL